MDPAARYRSLDHWRGFSALWIVWFHASTLWIRPADLPAAFMHDFAGLGWVGVHIFFVISGYCMAERFTRALHTSESPGGFLLDRAKRIYPAYWGALILSIFLAVVATPFNHRSILGDAVPADTLQLVADAALLAPLTAHQGYLLVSWTLSCEIAFYGLTACALFIRSAHRGPIGLCLGLILAASQAAGLVDIPGFMLDLWPEFMCGILAWVAMQSGHARLVAGAGIAVLGLLTCIHKNTTETLTFCALYAVLLMALKPFDQQIAGSRSIAWLGRVGALSYSVYLIHVPFISPLQNLLHRLMPESAPHQAWIPATLTALVLPPAWLFYHRLEKPVEQWRRRDRRVLDSAAGLHRVD